MTSSPYPGNANWPVDWQPATLTGHFVGLDGNPAAGEKVTLEAPVARISLPGSNTVVLARTLFIELDDNGSFSIDVPATDDPDTVPTGWQYTFTDPDGNTAKVDAPAGTVVDVSDELIDTIVLPDGAALARGPAGPSGPAGPPGATPLQLPTQTAVDAAVENARSLYALDVGELWDQDFSNTMGLRRRRYGPYIVPDWWNADGLFADRMFDLFNARRSYMVQRQGFAPSTSRGAGLPATKSGLGMEVLLRNVTKWVANNRSTVLFADPITGRTLGDPYPDVAIPYKMPLIPSWPETYIYGDGKTEVYSGATGRFVFGTRYRAWSERAVALDDGSLAQWFSTDLTGGYTWDRFTSLSNGFSTVSGQRNWELTETFAGIIISNYAKGDRTFSMDEVTPRTSRWNTINAARSARGLPALVPPSGYAVGDEVVMMGPPNPIDAHEVQWVLYTTVTAVDTNANTVTLADGAKSAGLVNTYGWVPGGGGQPSLVPGSAPGVIDNTQRHMIYKVDSSRLPRNNVGWEKLRIIGNAMSDGSQVGRMTGGISHGMGIMTTSSDIACYGGEQGQDVNATQDAIIIRPSQLGSDAAYIGSGRCVAVASGSARVYDPHWKNGKDEPFQTESYGHLDLFGTVRLENGLPGRDNTLAMFLASGGGQQRVRNVRLRGNSAPLDRIVNEATHGTSIRFMESFEANYDDNLNAAFNARNWDDDLRPRISLLDTDGTRRDYKFGKKRYHTECYPILNGTNDHSIPPGLIAGLVGRRTGSAGLSTITVLGTGAVSYGAIGNSMTTVAATASGATQVFCPNARAIDVKSPFVWTNYDGNGTDFGTKILDYQVDGGGNKFWVLQDPLPAALANPLPASQKVYVSGSFPSGGIEANFEDIVAGLVPSATSGQNLNLARLRPGSSNGLRITGTSSVTGLDELWAEWSFFPLDYTTGEVIPGRNATDRYLSGSPAALIRGKRARITDQLDVRGATLLGISSGGVAPIRALPGTLGPRHLGNLGTAAAPTSGRAEYVPFLIGGSGQTVDAFILTTGSAIQAGGAATIQLGLYKANAANTGPDYAQQVAAATLADSQLKALTASAQNAVPFAGGAVALAGGWYWGAFLYYATSAPTTTGTYDNYGSIVTNELGLTTAGAAFRVLAALTQTALPTSGTTPALSGINLNHPVLKLRATS